MRILACLLLSISVLAANAQAQTAEESQAAAVAAIKKLGGVVDESSEPVKLVSFRGTSVTDAGLAHLKNLTSLYSLYINDTQITDAGLETDLIFKDGLDLPDFASFPLVETAEGREILTRYSWGLPEDLRTAIRGGAASAL